MWHKPRPLSWSHPQVSSVQWDRSVHPSKAHSDLWSRESCCGDQTGGQVIEQGQLGRGQTLEPRQVQLQSPPLKASRFGEVVAAFLGVARRHAQWFKQLRRLQAISKSLNPARGEAGVGQVHLGIGF